MRAAVLLAAFALALAGAATAGAHSRDPTQRHTAADTQKAKSLALRRSDLNKGWTTDKPVKPAPPCTAGPDESKLVQTARVDPSFTWKDGVTNIGSEVDIFRSAREARTDWNLSTVKLMGTCLLQSARAGAKGKLRFSLVSEKRLPPPTSAPRGLHFRFVLDVTAKQKVRLVADVLALNRGRVTVVLHTLTVQSPLPAVVVDSLLGVLADRLNASGVTA